MQIKAGLKKEFIYFAKSFRIWGVLIAMIAFALFSPLMMKATDILLDETMELVEGATEDAEETATDLESGTVDGSVVVEEEIMFNCPDCDYPITYTEYDNLMAQQMMNDMMAQNEEVFELVDTYNSIRYGTSMVLSGISANAILVLLLCMMATSGGEQKKRNVIIPNCSGLTTWGYILPKFIFYPLFTLVSSMAVSYLGYWMCTGLYNATLPALDVFNFIFSNSIFCVFVVTTYMFIGLSTGKAGLSAALVYIFINIFPTVLEYAEVNEYNPFSLMKYAYGINMTVDGKEMAISILMSLGLMIVFVILTYLFVNLRKIDNSKKVEVSDVSNN